MTNILPQAQSLNNILKTQNPIILDLLSTKGKKIFYPKEGILKQAAEAKGKAINASIGTALENDASPMRLKSIADKISLDPKDVFPYTPSFGKIELREIWQKLIFKKNPSLKGKISLPVVTTGITHGLSLAGYMFFNPGEKVIVSNKFWGNYKLIFQNGYDVVLDPFNLFKGDGFDIAAFREKLKGKNQKLNIILNFPNNPTGFTPSESEVSKIVDAIYQAAENNNQIVVIVDDAYFGLVFEDGIYEESIFVKLANLHQNILAVKLDGATKEDYVWGLRTGFITYACKGMTDDTCEILATKTAGAVRGSISNCPHLSQSLVLAALSSPNYEKEKQAKRALLHARFKKIKTLTKKEKYSQYFKPLPANSGYFICIELKQGLDAEVVRQLLLAKYDTGVIAIKNMIRLAFSSVPEKQIPALIDNIYLACQEIANKK